MIRREWGLRNGDTMNERTYTSIESSSQVVKTISLTRRGDPCIEEMDYVTNDMKVIVVAQHISWRIVHGPAQTKLDIS
jgi:hypothetical protein